MAEQFFGVVDLDTPGTQPEGTLDLESLKRDLRSIRDAIGPILEQPDLPGPVGLQEIELSLTISAEGKVFFIAKGAAEASITLRFARAARN